MRSPVTETTHSKQRLQGGLTEIPLGIDAGHQHFCGKEMFFSNKSEGIYIFSIKSIWQRIFDFGDQICS